MWVDLLIEPPSRRNTLVGSYKKILSPFLTSMLLIFDNNSSILL
jgi:hypothetical protein